MNRREIWRHVRYRVLTAWDRTTGLFSDAYWAIVWLRYAISLYRALDHHGRFAVYAYWKPLDASERPIFVKEICRAMEDAYERAHPESKEERGT